MAEVIKGVAYIGDGDRLDMSIERTPSCYTVRVGGSVKDILFEFSKDYGSRDEMLRGVIQALYGALCTPEEYAELLETVERCKEVICGDCSCR